MKKETICVIITTIFQTFLLSEIAFGMGFILEKRNNIFVYKRMHKNDIKKPKHINHFLSDLHLKNEENFTTVGNTISSESREHGHNISNEGKATVNTNEEKTKKVLTTSEKNKSEIEKIQKRSESVLLERSFSFNKEDIQIKPELLKELITQKYRKLFQRHEKDCGSSEIQIIILTFKIFFLTEHMKRHKKDFACLRGLFKCVSKRRKLLKYLGTKNKEVFDRITNFFGIKKPLLPRTPEYYSKKLKYVHFNNTKRFKNNEEKKKKDKLRKKNVQTDKIIFSH